MREVALKPASPPHPAISAESADFPFPTPCIVHKFQSSPGCDVQHFQWRINRRLAAFSPRDPRVAPTPLTSRFRSTFRRTKNPWLEKLLNSIELPVSRARSQVISSFLLSFFLSFRSLFFIFFLFFFPLSSPYFTNNRQEPTCDSTRRRRSQGGRDGERLSSRRFAESTGRIMEDM